MVGPRGGERDPCPHPPGGPRDAQCRRHSVPGLRGPAGGSDQTGVDAPLPSKEAMMVALVDAVIDQWEEQLTQTLGAAPAEVGAVDRIGAYARFVLAQDFDRSDVVVFADPRLHRTLVARWEGRMTPWWSVPEDATETVR